MAQQRIKLTASYYAKPNLVITPAQLLARHLWGLPTCSSNGEELPAEVVKQKILDAQLEVENYFGIRLFPQIIRENSEYIADQFTNYGFVKTTYNNQQPLQLEGIYGNGSQVVYPREWLSFRKEVSSRPGQQGDATGFKHYYLIPNGGGATTSSGVLYNGPFAAYTFRSGSNVPNYWYSTYVTGYKRLPGDLINIIEKLAAIQVLSQLGDTFLAPGVSSQSISLDGLSQSMSTIRNAQGGVYAPRITQYSKELLDKMEELRGKYRGILFDML